MLENFKGFEDLIGFTFTNEEEFLLFLKGAEILKVNPEKILGQALVELKSKLVQVSSKKGTSTKDIATHLGWYEEGTFEITNTSTDILIQTCIEAAN